MGRGVVDEEGTVDVQSVQNVQTGADVGVTDDRATATDVRRSWREQLDRSATRVPVLFTRGPEEFAVLPVPLLRDALRRSVRPPVVVTEDDGWSVLLEGHPVAADGGGLAEAVDDFVHALRDYADAWVERLHDVPNHRDAALLVQLVASSSDEQLRAWVVGDADPAPTT